MQWEQRLYYVIPTHKKTAVTGNQTQTVTKIFAQKVDTLILICIA
jgi:hypothetical protein